MLRFASVVPEIRTAHTGHHHTNHRVSRLLDPRIGTLADLDRSWTIEDRCSHHISSTSNDFLL